MRKFFILAVVFSLLGAWEARAEIPDVSSWDCPESFKERQPSYDAEICYPDGTYTDSYVAVAGEPVMIHAHLIVNGKERYLNAVKTAEGNWLEYTSDYDLSFYIRQVEGGLLFSLVDENGKVLGQRKLNKIK